VWAGGIVRHGKITLASVNPARLGSAADGAVTGNALAERSNRKWSEDEDRLLKEMRAAGKSFVRIAAALKRTLKGVRGRHAILRVRARLEPTNPSSEVPG
jgi:hypothetical protein